MSPHAILGVRADADVDEIRARYRELAKVCHPDAGGDAADFIRLQQAYQTLLEQSQNRSSASPPESSWQGDVAEPAPSTAADERPAWWDDIVQETSKREAPQEEKRRSLLQETALPDRSFGSLALATLGAAVVVTIAACVKGGTPDFGSLVGQLILYSTLLFVASAFSAAVGAGSDDESFVKTYLGVLSLLALALTVAVPLPFLKPA